MQTDSDIPFRTDRSFAVGVQHMPCLSASGKIPSSTEIGGILIHVQGSGSALLFIDSRKQLGVAFQLFSEAAQRCFAIIFGSSSVSLFSHSRKQLGVAFECFMKAARYRFSIIHEGKLGAAFECFTKAARPVVLK